MIPQQPQQQITYKKVLLTIKGQLEPPSLQSLLSSSSYTILPHQPIHAHPCKTTSKPLTMQTLPFHRKNCVTLENCSFTATMLEHQILQMQSGQNNNKNQSNKVIIVDSTGVQNRQKSSYPTPQILRKYTIIRGYNYQLPKQITDPKYTNLTKDIQLLISYQNIYKQLQYTFGSVGSAGDQQRGFIGQVDLAYHWENVQKGDSGFYGGAVRNLLRAYLDFSAKCKCPIFVNLLPLGSTAYTIVNHTQKPQSAKYQKYLYLFPISSLAQNTNPPYSSIILINPDITLTRQYTPSSSSSLSSCSYIQYTNILDKNIQQLFKLGYNILFDLTRYTTSSSSSSQNNNNQLCLYQIAKYVYQWPKQTIIASGLRFKTDFIQFAGNGLQIKGFLEKIKDIILQLQTNLSIKSNQQKENNIGHKINPDQIINMVTKENILNLLAWFTKKIVKVQVKMWKCVNCGKQLPQTQEAFKKFNKSFCCIDCLRTFKF